GRNNPRQGDNVTTQVYATTLVDISSRANSQATDIVPAVVGLKWSFDENSVWKTHLHHQLHTMTPSWVSAPTNQRQVCIPPQPITLQGFAFKDLQPWMSRASTLNHHITTIWLPSSFQHPYYRASTPSPVSDPRGGRHL
ncbi:hypothetical protein AMECASPLE_020320, partial [Ameca splendens]